MKFLSFIFSVYIAVLSCLDCDEGQLITSNYNNGQSIQAEQHQHSDDEGDCCSPFSNCSCSAGFYFTEQTTEFKRIEHQTNFIEERISSVIDISLPVWQPPKLS